MRKTVTLVIVIVLMIILALLGVTILQMQSTDMTVNFTSLDSERALYIAESGAEYALKKISEDGSWRTTGILHRLRYGEYEVVVRDPDSDEEGDVIVISTGYVPQKDDYRTKRQVKLNVEIGNLDKAVQAKGIFDWHLMHSGSYIDGDIAAKYYDGDGDVTYNEMGVDYDPLPLPVLPHDGSGDEREFIIEGAFPEMDFSYFESTWPTVKWYKGRTAVALSASSGNILVGPPHFFDGTTNEAVRNLTQDSKVTQTSDTSHGKHIAVDEDNFFTGTKGKIVRNLSHLTNTHWTDNDWAIIVNVSGNGKEATLDRDVGDTWDGDYIKIQGYDLWDDNNWAVITSVNSDGSQATLDKNIGDDWDNDIIHITKRFHQAFSWIYNWYVRGDIIFDVRTSNQYNVLTSFIAEGDIVIKGTYGLGIIPHFILPQYPALATKCGDIISLDTPRRRSWCWGGDEVCRAKNRTLAGLVYTEYGDVHLNYLNGVAVMGDNIYFNGYVRINYTSWLIDPDGFVFKPSIVTWQED